MANDRDSVPLDSPNPTASGSTAEAIRRVRRKRRRRMFFKILALIVIIVIAAAFYAQTSMALRQVWLPLVSREIGARVTADNGTIGYGGKLHLDRLTIMGTDNEPALTAENVAFEIAPLSLLKGSPHIVRANATKPSIRVRVGSDGRSNWDFPGLAASEPKGKSKEKEESAGLPNIRIDELFLQNVSLDMRKSDQLKINLGAPQIALKNFAPGKEAEFDVAINASLERPAEKMAQSGTLAAGGTIKQSADGRRIDWDTKLKSSFSGVAPGLEGAQKVDVQASSKGNYNLGGLLAQTFVLRASSPSGPAGSIDGDMKWDLKQNTRNVKLAIGGIGRESLNPILAAIAPLQLQRGKIDGTATVEGKGDQVAFKADIAAEGLSFELVGQKKPTSIMNIRVRQSGDMDLKTNALTWRQAELTLSDENHRLVQAALDKPLSILMGGAAAKSADVGPAVFRVTIDGLTAINMQPWLMLANVAPESQPTAGTLSGDFTVGISRQSAQLKAEGRLTADGLIQPALGPNPVNLRNQFEMAFADFTNLDIQKMTIELASARGTVAQAALTGRMRLKQQTSEIDIDLTVTEALAAALHFGLLAKPAEGVRDGRLQLQQDIKLDLAKGKTSASGKLSLTGMSMTNATGQTTLLNMTGENRLTFDTKRSRVDIESARLNLDYGATKPGLVELTGHWEQTGQRTAAARYGVGALHLTASGINLTPWLLASGAIAGRDAPPIPFEANEQIAADADGLLHVQGDLRLGIDPGKTANARMREFTLVINHDLVQSGAQVQKAFLDISTQAGGGASDRVRIDATGELGDAPRIQLAAHAEKLDLNPYLAWSDRLTTPSLKTASAAAAKSTGAKPGQPARTVIDARLAVDELQYHDSKLTKAQATYRYDRGAMTINVTQGIFNDGALKGEANIDLTRSEPRYAWNFSLAKANANSVLTMANPSMIDRISGELTLNSRCTGEGSGDTFKRTLQGQNTFTIVNGEMHGITLLDILAKQTLVGSFSNLKFFDFSGGIDIANKAGKLKDVKISGPEHRIDIEGQFDFDGNYDVTLLPAVATGVARSIQNNSWLPSLVQATPGFLQFPFKVAVKGDSKGYRVLPLARLPVNIGNVTGAVGGAVEGIVGGAAGAVGGVIKEIPGSGVVTRPMKELKMLNPFSRDQATTK